MSVLLRPRWPKSVKGTLTDSESLRVPLTDGGAGQRSGEGGAE